MTDLKNVSLSTRHSARMARSSICCRRALNSRVWALAFACMGPQRATFAGQGAVGNLADANGRAKRS